MSPKHVCESLVYMLGTCDCGYNPRCFPQLGQRRCNGFSTTLQEERSACMVKEQIMPQLEDGKLHGTVTGKWRAKGSYVLSSFAITCNTPHMPTVSAYSWRQGMG